MDQVVKRAPSAVRRRETSLRAAEVSSLAGQQATPAARAAIQPGIRQDREPTVTGNMLLLGLPAPTYARLKPHLGRVVLPAHWTVIKPDESNGTAYFTESGVLYAIVRRTEGAAVQVTPV